MQRVRALKKKKIVLSFESPKVTFQLARIQSVYKKCIVPKDGRVYNQFRCGQV